jgi:tetratricopeptide (TPR) repeat protein
MLIGYLIAIALLLFIKNEIAPFSNVKESAEIMNNPFLNVPPLQKLCTKIYILLLYLKMLFVPYPLSYDYSFHQIPYINPSNIFVYISILIYGALAVLAFIKLKSKSLLSFAIIMFFITFSISSNLLIDIGMAMGERLLFVPSLFFMLMLVIVGKSVIDYIHSTFNLNKWIPTAAILLPILISSAMITFARNKEWKDDLTLNITDFKKCPNSARIANGAGTSYIKLSEQKEFSIAQRDSILKIAINCFNQALIIHPTFDDAFLNKGVAYSRMDSIDAAEKNWNIVRAHASSHPKFIQFNNYLTAKYLTLGLACGNRRSLDSSIVYLEKACKYAIYDDASTLESFYNLGGAYYTAGKFEKAKIAFSKVMLINPNFKDAKLGLAAAEAGLQKK